MDVKEYDSWIIRYGTVYLVGMPYEDTGMCRLSNSPWDAVPISDEHAARRLARMSGGEAVTWNPVTGRITEGIDSNA
jgi:nitrous oxide reductase accessory protein NosL